MMSDLERIDKRLDLMDGKIDTLIDAVAQIAVQNQRLATLDRDTSNLDVRISDAEKEIKAITKFQASCPRHGLSKQLNVLWVFVVSIVVAIIGTWIKS